MKRALICGFLGVISSMWAFVLMVYVNNNLLSSWSGNRFWNSALSLGVMLPLVGSLFIMFTSLIGLVVEYFRKE